MERFDFNGQTIRVSYDTYNMYSFVDHDDGILKGSVVDAFAEIATMLNLSVIYEPFTNPGIWGLRRENGTWSGAIGKYNHDNVIAYKHAVLGDILLGIHDMSVAGFSPTEERSKVLDFLPEIGVSNQGVVIPRPKGSEITLDNHTKQFQPLVWLMVLLSYLIFWLLLSLLFYLDHKRSVTLTRAVTTSIDFVFRAAVGKVFSIFLNCLNYSILFQGAPALKPSQHSTRVALFCLTIMTFVILSNYRAIMNAFLTARELKLPFNSYEEILDSDLDAITFKESSNEEYFKSAPKGSILRRMFDEKISKDLSSLRW